MTHQTNIKLLRNNMQIKGTIIHLSEATTVNASVTKRELVIKTDEKYPQTIKFDFLNKSLDCLDNSKNGEVVDVHFNIRGSKWNDKYYTNLVGWKIDKGESPQPAQKSKPSVANTAPQKTAPPAKKALVPDFDIEEDAQPTAPAQVPEEEDLTF